jgi:hypothetical protein
MQVALQHAQIYFADMGGPFIVTVLALAIYFTAEPIVLDLVRYHKLLPILIFSELQRT